jgi:hypothetical protein
VLFVSQGITAMPLYRPNFRLLILSQIVSALVAVTTNPARADQYLFDFSGSIIQTATISGATINVTNGPGPIYIDSIVDGTFSLGGSSSTISWDSITPSTALFNYPSNPFFTSSVTVPFVFYQALGFTANGTHYYFAATPTPGYGIYFTDSTGAELISGGINSSVTITPLPEIDSGTLPKAALLLFSLYLIGSGRRRQSNDANAP